MTVKEHEDRHGKTITPEAEKIVREQMAIHDKVLNLDKVLTEAQAISDKMLSQPDLGVLLKAYRKLENLGLRDTARLSGIAHSHLQGIEAGRVTPSVFVLNTILNVLQAIPAHKATFFKL